MIFDFCTSNIKRVKSIKNASDSFKSKEYKKNILCVSTSCKWRAKSNRKRKSCWNNRKKFVWSRNEQKDIRADVASIRSNSIATSNCTSIFAFGTRRSRNLLSSLLSMWFHLLFRLFHLFSNRWSSHLSRHLSSHRNFYLSRCSHQKLYASVQRAYHLLRRLQHLQHQESRYSGQKSSHDLLRRNSLVSRLRHSNRCANRWRMQALLARLLRLELLHHRGPISSWTICITCSLRSRVHLVCSDIKCARFFRKVLANAVVTAVSKANVTSYKVALRHTFMRRSHLLRNRSNSKHLSQHMLAKAFRVTFRSFTRSHLSLVLFDFQEFLVRLLFADIVKSVLSSIDLSIESCQMLQKLRTMRYSRECVIDVSFLFVLLWESIDFSLKKSLLWES